jgi:hypothetical protein
LSASVDSFNFSSTVTRRFASALGGKSGIGAPSA